MESIKESIFSPSTPMLVVITLLIALVPIFIHFVIFRTGVANSIPTFVLLGPSGSGKTSLCVWFEKGHVVETRTSQTTLALECDIPASLTASAQYRSANDPSLKKEHKKFLLVDTPGHAKLRDLAFSEITKPGSKVVGLIYTIDSADDLSKAAEYLHDLLLLLQKLGGKIGGQKKTSLLVACNKNDLFTALPAGRIKTQLEKEISKIRESRAKGLMDSGAAGADDIGREEESEWLGEGGEGEFRFEMMEEAGVTVSVKGGSVERGDCEYWRQWVGSCL
ncbi:signal recognition particle receptor beta subunit-domain-containing protein [Peziza echinospora]|nr:signal recognition particle receptor beta subunit-domain-containing protein [Peziza echinospora]